MSKLKKIVSLSTGIVLLLCGVVVLTNKAESSLLDNVSGYAWGADSDAGAVGGLGWVSFNCTTGGNCANAEYGINVDEETGYMSGYAWSPNFGWLKFGGLSGFPSADPQYGTTFDNAKINFTGNPPYQVTGWARFCAPASSPSNCSGTSSNFSNGGWDGWVSLSGDDGPANNPYGIYLTGEGIFQGYAWSGGSDSSGNSNVTGAGWISFDGDGYEVVFEPVSSPTVLLEASATNIPVGGTVTLAWDGEGLLNSPTGCTATGDWTGQHTSPASPALPQGGYTTPTLNTAGTYYFHIQCLGLDGVTLSNISTVSVQVGINLVLWAQPSAAYPADYKVSLHWETLPANVPNGSLTGCVATDNAIETTGWEGYNVGNIPPFGSTPPEIYVPASPSPVEFTLTCYSGTTAVSDTAPVSRAPASDFVELYNDATPFLVGPGVYSTTFEWLSGYVEDGSCAGSVSFPSGITPITTNWEGLVGPLSDGVDHGEETGILVPETNDINVCTTYTITCESELDGQDVVDSICVNEFSPAGVRTPKFIED